MPSARGRSTARSVAARSLQSRRRRPRTARRRSAIRSALPPLPRERRRVRGVARMANMSRSSWLPCRRPARPASRRAARPASGSTLRGHDALTRSVRLARAARPSWHLLSLRRLAVLRCDPAQDLAPPGIASRQQLLESDGPRASALAKLGVDEDGPAANPRGEARAPGALGIPAREREAHQRAAAVVAEAPLVLGRAGAVPAQMRIRELAEHPGTDEAANAVLGDGLPGVGKEGSQRSEDGRQADRAGLIAHLGRHDGENAVGAHRPPSLAVTGPAWSAPSIRSQCVSTRSAPDRPGSARS